MSNTNGRRADVLAVLRRADAPMSIAAIADQLAPMTGLSTTG